MAIATMPKSEGERRRATMRNVPQVRIWLDQSATARPTRWRASERLILPGGAAAPDDAEFPETGAMVSVESTESFTAAAR